MSDPFSTYPSFSPHEHLDPLFRGMILGDRRLDEWNQEKIIAAASHLARCGYCQANFAVLSAFIDYVSQVDEHGPDIPDELELALFSAAIATSGLEAANELYPDIAQHLTHCAICQDIIAFNLKGETDDAMEESQPTSLPIRHFPGQRNNSHPYAPGIKPEQVSGPIPSIVPQQPISRVFLTYIKRDADYAQRFVAECTRQGIAVWDDQRPLNYSDDWYAATRRALRSSSTFVFILSQAAQRSRESQQEYEEFAAMHADDPTALSIFLQVDANITKEAIPQHALLLDGRDDNIAKAVGQLQILLNRPNDLRPIPQERHRMEGELPFGQSMPRTPDSSQLPPRLAQLGFRLEWFPAGFSHIIPPVVAIQGGTMLLGDDNDHGLGNISHAPAHAQYIEPFHIGQYPVTVAEYALAVVAGAVPPPQPAANVQQPLMWVEQLQHPANPVVNVSWNDAIAYIAWLNRSSQANWRLLTEVEWAFAAAGPNRRAISGANAGRRGADNPPLPIGSMFQDISPFAVHDMVGNVWEWTSSAALPYPYVARESERHRQMPFHRILRGGNAVRIATGLARQALQQRWMANPANQQADWGFRLAY